MAAPRGAIGDPGARQRVAILRGQRLRRGTRRRSRGRPPGPRAAARNRSRNGWWWPYSSPSVATSTSGEPACQLDELSRWSGLEVRGRTQSRAKRSASAVTVRLERDGAREAGVVEGHDERPTAAEVDAVRPPGFDRRRRPPATAPARSSGSPPRRASAGPPRPRPSRGARSRSADGRTGAVVADAPADLGPPIARGGEGEDRVVEALGHGVLGVRPAAAIRARTSGIVARQRTLVRVGPTLKEIRSRLPRSAFGPVALGRDPRVPAGGYGAALGSGRGRPAERVAPLRLVEVGVDREAAAGHRGSRSPSSAARSRVVVTVCSMRTVVAAPGARTSGQAKTSAEPW